MIYHNHVIAHDLMNRLWLCISHYLSLLLSCGIIGKNTLGMTLSKHGWGHIWKCNLITRHFNLEAVISVGNCGLLFSRKVCILHNACWWQLLGDHVWVIILILFNSLLLQFLNITILNNIVSLQGSCLQIDWLLVTMTLQKLLLLLFFITVLIVHSWCHLSMILRSWLLLWNWVNTVSSLLHWVVTIFCSAYCSWTNYWAICGNLRLWTSTIHDLCDLGGSNRVVRSFCEETTRANCLSLGYGRMLLYKLLLGGWRRHRMMLLIGLCRWNILPIALWDTTLSHLLDSLLLLSRLIHALKLLLHSALLSFWSSSLGRIGLLGACWLTWDVRREGALLSILFIFVLFFSLLGFISLILAHLVESFISRCCLSGSGNTRSLSLSDLRCKSALLELSCFLRSLRLIFPLRSRFSLLLGEPLKCINVTSVNSLAINTVGMLIVTISSIIQMILSHLLCTVFGCELVSLGAEDGLGVIYLLLSFDSLFELFLSLDANTLQLESVGVKQIKSFLDLWQFFISEEEDPIRSSGFSKPNLTFRLWNGDLRGVEKVLSIVDLQDGHDNGFQITWCDLLSLHLGYVGTFKLFEGFVIVLIHFIW